MTPDRQPPTEPILRPCEPLRLRPFYAALSWDAPAVRAQRQVPVDARWAARSMLSSKAFRRARRDPWGMWLHGVAATRPRGINRAVCDNCRTKHVASGAK